MWISRQRILRNIFFQTHRNDNFHDEYESWNYFDTFVSDHIQEILKKWEQIDDEIWGKIICMERNRRIAKAYARVPVLTVSGSDDGFDGFKIGLNGFDRAPSRDPLVKRVRDHIGEGVRIKMDEFGNIIIKRLSHCDVFIRGYDREANSISKGILDLDGELTLEKSVKLFDMKKFQSGLNKELRSAYPDRRRLENQCINVIAFVKDATDVLDLPVWIMVVNIVALDMLKSKLPQVCYRNENVPKFVNVFTKPEQDEDPYSVPSLPTSKRPQITSGKQSNHRVNANNNTALITSAVNNNNNVNVNNVNNNNNSKTSDAKPPELPPRDFAKIKKTKEKKIPSMFKSLVRGESRKQTAATPAPKKEVDYEDPYYCGMQARVSHFAVPRERKPAAGLTSLQDMRKSHSSGYLNSLFNPSSNFNPYRGGSSYYSYYDSTFESDPYMSSGDGYDTYAPLYGRTPNLFSAHHHHQQPQQRRHQPQRAYLCEVQGERYATEWD
ncbi:uncharacterized protein LOC107360770 isoform X2 [Tetranychus urticae]|uniref:uncharacterized protein LOC107360770 isoform X2 n=1 Tax=Tetranychus urticae TaxID=32264 RepID=UPI00077BA711|nr:uncharacterized protein LOC107360770 isoform X2 [Tetranychus urticae]